MTDEKRLNLELARELFITEAKNLRQQIEDNRVWVFLTLKDFDLALYQMTRAERAFGNNNNIGEENGS